MTDADITYRGTVYPWHCDQLGHMNVMFYVGKFDEGTWQLFHRCGFTPKHFREHGTGMAAVEQTITYKRELRAGDVITVRSRMLEIKEKTIKLLHEMTNDETGELAASCTILGVHMDTKLRKSCPIPADLRARASAVVAGGAAQGRP